VRILIYDPNSEVLKLRAADEEDRFIEIVQEKVYEMQHEINSTLNIMVEGWRNLPVAVRTNLEIRLTNKTLHLAQIIRADERMLVAIYLSGKSGALSPTLQLKGSESSYFVTYAKQFEILWRRGEPLTDD
jgi:hypothetical protein